MIKIETNLAFGGQGEAVVRAFDGKTPQGPRSYDQFIVAVENHFKSLATLDGLKNWGHLGGAIFFGAVGSFAVRRAGILSKVVQGLGDEIFAGAFTAVSRSNQTGESYCDALLKDGGTGIAARILLGAGGIALQLLPQTRLASAIFLPCLIAGANWISEALIEKNVSIKGEGLGWEFLCRAVTAGTMICQARLLKVVGLHADGWNYSEKSLAELTGIRNLVDQLNGLQPAFAMAGPAQPHILAMSAIRETSSTRPKVAEPPKESSADLTERFEVVNPLGKGGQAYVAVIREKATGHHYFLRRVPRTADVEELERMKREYRALRNLLHPSIARVFETGEWKDSLQQEYTYLIMELAEGRNGMEHLTGKAPTRFTEATLMNIGLQIQGALQTSHRKGIIHRDVKPSNIMIAGESAKLVDFGVARFVGQETQTFGPFGPGGVGTVWYIAPEVMRGEKATEKADIYGLGLTLLTLATKPRTRPVDLDSPLHEIERMLRADQTYLSRDFLHRLMIMLNPDPQKREFAFDMSDNEVQKRLEKGILQSFAGFFRGVPAPLADVATTDRPSHVTVLTNQAVREQLPAELAVDRLALDKVAEQIVGLPDYERALALAKANSKGGKVYLVGSQVYRLLTKVLFGIEANLANKEADYDFLVEGITRFQHIPDSVKDDRWVAFFGGSSGGRVRKINPFITTSGPSARSFQKRELKIDLFTIGSFQNAEMTSNGMLADYFASVPLGIQMIAFDVDTHELIGPGGLPAGFADRRVVINNRAELEHAARWRKISPDRYMADKSEGLPFEIELY
ncbi:MAG: serine/threonine-protein kinase [Deltaproteobacteria bacterium]|nr:serine/threonine-protein kinase [Deltaproteobacteria bacterium]